VHGNGVCSARWLACLCISIHAHFFPTITQHTASTRYLPLRVRFAFGLKRESVVHQRAWVHVLMGQGRRVYDTDTQQIVSLIMKIRGAQALKIREA
jgi:hypothetical protein